MESTQQLDSPDSTNIPMRYTIYGIHAQLAMPDSTNIPMRYIVYEMMLLMMDW